jgi:hypothetical protein
MKKLKIVISWFVLISACSEKDQILSPLKHIGSVGDSVFVQGRWKRTPDSSKTSIGPAQINTVYITCDKESMACEEVWAEVLTPNDAFYAKTKTLMVHELTYSIVKWSNEIIHATYTAPVADFELRISVKDAVAERHWRETKARGSDTADPNLYTHYILE